MPSEKTAVTDMFRQRTVIEFLVNDGDWAGVVCERLRGVYGDDSSVRRWVEHFKDGNTDIADQPRCGRPSTAATECNKQKVDELIKDQRITFREIAAQLGVGHHAVQEMMEILEYWKACSRWVSCLFTGAEEQNGWELHSHPPYSPNLAP
jgi:transposase